MNATDKMMAWAQIGLSVLFIVGTFIIIGVYELGFAKFPTTDQLKDFSGTLNWLTGACLIIVYFWFQRQRTAGMPDSANTVTQTHTGADGSKTVITSPVSAPLPPTPGVSNAPTLKQPTPPQAAVSSNTPVIHPISPIGSDTRV